MHWIERPPEPSELQSIRARQTGGWVRYYPDRKSPRPTDRQWSRFVDDLNAAFGDICAYCEETCKPEVDHFRPTSRYPWLVYRWSNLAVLVLPLQQHQTCPMAFNRLRRSVCQPFTRNAGALFQV